MSGLIEELLKDISEIKILQYIKWTNFKDGYPIPTTRSVIVTKNVSIIPGYPELNVYFADPSKYVWKNIRNERSQLAGKEYMKTHKEDSYWAYLPLEQILGKYLLMPDEN